MHAEVANMAEKALVLLLRIAGVVLLTALVPAVMPFDWMKDIHRQLGMGELPEGPIIGCLTRRFDLEFLNWPGRKRLDMLMSH